VVQARQIVTKLLEDKVTFTPETNGRKGFRFRASGTVVKLVTGLIPGFVGFARGGVPKGNSRPV
jgi:hypothetical protein